MRQIVQYFDSGDTELLDVPVPQIRSGCLLIESAYSLISSGTERTLVDFGKAGYLSKALKQPDKVKQVINKIKLIY